MGEVKRTIVMCLLVMSLLVVSFTREVNAAPQQKNTEVPNAPGTTTKRSAYSPIADIGRLAQGTAGMFGQFWNTGARLGGEFSRRAFEFLKLLTVLFLVGMLAVICAAPVAAPEKEETTTKEDSTTKSADSPDVKTDDHPKDMPDMKPMEFMQNVIKAAMDRVFPGAKNIPSVLPFQF
uniref:Transmembrane protein n=1 Tax=Anopheles culicifacies TaxID=139723 RepID=A0A182MBB1_9DIPT